MIKISSGKNIQSISKKIKRSIGILSKTRYYVNFEILISLYYSIVYPLLTYGLLTHGLVTWGNSYPTNMKHLFALPKRALSIITFLPLDKDSSLLLKLTKILKFFDLIKFQTSIFMYKFHNNQLPTVFANYFYKTAMKHSYETRLSTKKAYAIPEARTNYGILNIKFSGAKLWNSLDIEIYTSFKII